jgi:tetratricopeptide (TPR) repeat protein
VNVGAVRTLVAVLALAAGCATATIEGRAALGRGSYEEAARHFEAALARHPGRVEDLLGLGVARYKLDALDEAERTLEEALAREPGLPPAHLYLAMIALRRGDHATADARLAQSLALAPPRLAALIDRTRRTLPAVTTPELRAYVAASLEDGYQWAGEVAGAVQAARDAELRCLAFERIHVLPGHYRCW